MATPIMYKSNESDTNKCLWHESIPEIDSTLKLTVQPYQYEPIKRQETTRQWCSCKNCITMPTAKECKCCLFYAAIESRLEERGETCITEHEGFAANCLNRWVLETSFYEYLEEH
ncbi:uncharacterized protein LOC133193246 [Saccostrea echinata]|uniref:uncharacterized protein LOC133193246 n=1 Tax=Saccostrea echinata TaxID=191078 RepID=UPI002A840137|nr:uncharacterized protein LOC133193246 [Saccostrea echinata]